LMGSEPRPLSIQSAAIVPGLFAFTVFFGAMLLFLLEPYVGKSLLPHFGGSPAVWNTCVFFFQFLLLAGYVYVHVINRYLSIPAQLLAHGLIIAAALATLPLRFSTIAAAQVSNQPIASLLRALVLSAGLPFFVASTTAPLAQAWYTRVRSHSSPYWLYVASNAGSLAALIAYPAFIEDWLPLTRQSSYWTYSFLAFACLSLVCGLCAYFHSPGPASTGPVLSAPHEDATPRRRLSWLLLSLCPSTLMLGVTIYLSSQIAPIPVLWVLPLAVYLLSFMIAFANPPDWLVRASGIGFVILTGLVAFAEFFAVSHRLIEQHHLLGVVFHVTILFLGATALHSQLARLRPAPVHLTEYYLWISLGGLCGGIISSLLAPVLLNWLAEYPLAIVIGLFLVPWPFKMFRPGRQLQGALRFVIAVAVFLGLSWNVYFSELARHVIYRERTFFGPFSIGEGKREVTHVLLHGNINHGMQNVGGRDRRARRLPLTYYFGTGPIGQLFMHYRGTEVTRSVGIAGLGIGSLASYGDPGQDYTFYEIDPAIDRVAWTPRWFTYLVDATDRGVKVSTKIGDARLRLREAPAQAYGLLILDAFTSDSVPVHLITREAVSLYLSKLQPHGLLVFNISNQYVDLEPFLANIAADLGLVACIQVEYQIAEAEEKLGKKGSTWLVMARATEDLKPLLTDGRWRPCQPNPKPGIWTDDRSNLFRAVRW
jgi:hypothetical protein